MILFKNQHNDKLFLGHLVFFLYNQGMDYENRDKLSLIKVELAKEFVLLNVGDRLESITYYENKFNVARGTIQNAIKSLCDDKAISIIAKGRNGTFLQNIDYGKLQNDFGIGSLIGAFTMPASITTKGLATAFYKTLGSLDCSIVYARNAKIRIKMLQEGKCDFTVCSMHSAEKYLENNRHIKLLFNFGPYTYLSESILIFRDKEKKKLEPHMRIGYDPDNDDYTSMIDFVSKDIKNLQFVEVKNQKIPEALQKGLIDVGVWAKADIQNFDFEFGFAKINSAYILDFTTAILLIRNNDSLTEKLLGKYINISAVVKTQYSVVNGLLDADY